MKKHIVGFLLAVGLCLLLGPGCATTDDGGDNTTNRIYAITRLTAYVGAVAVQQSHPEQLPNLQAVKKGACGLKDAQTWDIATLIAIASQNGLTDWDSSEGKLILAAVPLLIDLFTGKTYQLDQPENAKAVIRGLCDGLTLALPDTVSRAKPSQVRDSVEGALLQSAIRTRPRR